MFLENPPCGSEYVRIVGTKIVDLGHLECDNECGGQVLYVRQVHSALRYEDTRYDCHRT